MNFVTSGSPQSVSANLISSFCHSENPILLVVKKKSLAIFRLVHLEFLSSNLIASVCSHFKPVYQFTTFGALVFSYFLRNPLRNTNFFHSNRIGNYIGMIANTINNRLCAKLSQLITRKLLTFITPCNMVACSTLQKAMVSTVFTAITNKIRKATMTHIGKSRTRSTKQATYRCTFFVRDSFHKQIPRQIFSYCSDCTKKL